MEADYSNGEGWFELLGYILEPSEAYGSRDKGLLGSLILRLPHNSCSAWAPKPTFPGSQLLSTIFKKWSNLPAESFRSSRLDFVRKQAQLDRSHLVTSLPRA